MRTGLVLSGGGARGAYQVGVLRGLAEILPKARALPFPVLAGASAGSITCAFLAARASDFLSAVRKLVDFWGSIAPHDVFRTDTRTLARVALGWAEDLTLGGWIGSGRGRSLLMSDPLRALLIERLDILAIRENIARGLVHGIALTTTNYRTSLSVTFFDGAEDIAPWDRSMRVGVRQHLTIEHIMASSSIPMFFPAIPIGSEYYADGCVRLMTPLSPAVHMGADRILAIGVRHWEPADRKAASPCTVVEPYPTVAETAGLLLNALFLEALETDVERFERIDHAMTLVPAGTFERDGVPLRSVPLLVLRPSRSLGELAAGAIRRLPYVVRHLFRGLGVTDRSGVDLLSYLAFDAEFASKLLALGYADVMSRRDELSAFLSCEVEA